MVFLKLIVQVFFVCVELSWVGGEGWGPMDHGVGVRRMGGGPNFRAFIFSPATIFFLFFSLLESFRGIWVVSEALEPSNVRVWSSLVVM